MSVLKSIEHRIESLLEGAFRRVSRSHVQPVELARKLAKEMDEHKTVSVSRVYVPNEYMLYLSPTDREQFASYEDSLLTELGDYLSEHARREGYALLSTPKVTLDEDEDLGVGEFGIATRMVQPKRPDRAAAASAGSPAPAVVADDAPGETKIFKPLDTAAVSAEDAASYGLVREHPKLVIAGQKHDLEKRTVVLGRSRECDIPLNDANVSRRHAEIRQENGAYWIVDLGSTNGIEVNGRRVDRAKLEHDDLIVLGKTRATFDRGF